MPETVVASVPDPSLLSPALAIPASSRSDPNNNNVYLDLRNQKFTIDREALMELPESILLCLFPNGVVLSQKQHASHSTTTTGPAPQSETEERATDEEDEDEEEEVYYVDFDGPCLSFILKYFHDARLAYYGTIARPHEPPLTNSKLPSPLFYRQAIIVLREELEYFAIPPRSASTSDRKDSDTNQHLAQLKRACGATLLDKRSIFTALLRNVNRENNIAEQHLIDMLCMSGFSREDVWGYRSLEPRRCCITSLALVLLKTGIKHSHPDSTEMTGPKSTHQINPEVDSPQMTTAQKLLLFWRKPARKCWWDSTDLTVKLTETETCVVKLWARRVWTLELSLI